MSVSGISSTSLYSYNVQSTLQQAQQAFQQLGQDLQSGNLSGAQQDFANIQKDFQSQATQSASSTVQGRHHHHGGSGSSETSQLFDQLGAALQSGDLSSAQQAYNSLVQQFQQSGQSGAPQSQTQVSPSSGGVSVTA